MHILICLLVPATSFLMLVLFQDPNTLPTTLGTGSLGLDEGFGAMLSAMAMITAFFWSVLPYVAAIIIAVFVGLAKHQHNPTTGLGSVVCGVISGASVAVVLPLLTMPRSLSLVLIVAATVVFGIFMALQRPKAPSFYTTREHALTGHTVMVSVMFVGLILVGGASILVAEDGRALSTIEHYTSSMGAQEVAQADTINMPILLDGTTIAPLRAWLASDAALQAPGTSSPYQLHGSIVSDRILFTIPVSLDGYEDAAVSCTHKTGRHAWTDGRLKGLPGIHSRADILAERLCILRKDEFSTLNNTD